MANKKIVFKAKCRCKIFSNILPIYIQVFKSALTKAERKIVEKQIEKSVKYMLKKKPRRPNESICFLFLFFI